MSLQATIPSSTDLRLAAIAGRVCRAGPDVLLAMMRAQLTSSSAAPAVARRWLYSSASERPRFLRPLASLISQVASKRCDDDCHNAPQLSG
jgi:hypothetical protein